MENYAKRLALEHNVHGKASRRHYPVDSLKKDFETIKRAYTILTESVSLDVPLPPSGEWLLDNFYVIEEQVDSIQKELTIEKYRQLPGIKGIARIYILAEEFVAYMDGNLSKETIEKFFVAYESKRKISMEEIWFLPIMLKIAIIRYMKVVAERMINSQYQKFKVASLVERLVKSKAINEQIFYQYHNIKLNGEITAYIEYLVYLLKKEGKRAKKYLEILNEEVRKAGSTLDEMIKIEHFEMALRRVSISNSITSLKNILRYHWSNIFERINGIETILLQDEWYQKSDYDTKTLYREAIQKIAKKTKLSEMYIANQLVEMASLEGTHIGMYLLGEKKIHFLKSLGMKTARKISFHQKTFWYLCMIYLPSFVISIGFLKAYFFLGIIPLSEVFSLIINRIVMMFQKPHILPRIENIPPEVNTMVIVPTLVKSKERVKEMMHQLEIFYLSNPMEQLYFAFLGDASEEEREEMPFDQEIMEEGKKDAQELNQKYHSNRFFFLYRKRVYNISQKKWLGYERKRGMITEFVRYLEEKNAGTFAINTIEELPPIKYIITLDADTLLPMDCARKLIGTMEHPLNTPHVEGKIVTKGYGLIQPKVGITMESATSSFFAKIMAGEGGIDAYTTAEFNVYQDLFGEAIFTGKGIFRVDLFHQLLKNEIPENTVLSHDLLEGSYLRCGLASDIEVMDGFPSKVNSYMLRLHRWTRGDWQILSWLRKDAVNVLSKYKIVDNLRRSVLPIFTLLLFGTRFFGLSLFVLFFPFILDSFEKISHPKRGKRAKNYLPIVHGLRGSFLRCTFEVIILPYKAFLMLKAITVTLYRMYISKEHLLEWLTASDAEKSLGNGLWCYEKEMIVSLISAVLLCFFSSFSLWVISILWFLAPMVCYQISKKEKIFQASLSEKDQKELKEIAFQTWKYFDDAMTEENHFLPPDNYQVGRKNKFVNVTSSTNIGLSLLAILSAYDMHFISLECCLQKLKKSIDVIESLKKWNGHLYNWYHIQQLVPLHPLFVSTVDSGNFVGYLFVVRQFLKENGEEGYQKKVNQLIHNTNFSKLYDADKNIFSIGFDIHENKLVDSYYDLLASEARLGSFVAIAKKDVPYKHWFSMSRTLTCVGRYKGLVSWSGTMFEYFMPCLIMKDYPYTLLDETYAFCVYSQKKYAHKLNIPWGISESAFYLQDLHYNYQYKAFGIPWLGLKRGLKDEVVVSPYSSFLALDRYPQDVIKNIYELKKIGAYDIYGFYDAVDYTPNRVSISGYSIVKTFMAHHQALILLSINNYCNQHILQERFMKNEEIESASLLLQERVPTEVFFTKKKKEKIKVLKYKNYEEHIEYQIKKPCGNVNLQSNGEYTLLVNDWGEGYAKYQNLLLTKQNDMIKQGSCVYIKNLQTGEVESNTPFPIYQDNEEYEIFFSPSNAKFYRRNSDYKVKTQIVVSTEENMELREIEIENISEKELQLEVITYLEPVLASQSADIVHPAYNNLFFRSISYENAIILEKRMHNDIIYFLNFLFSEEKELLEFELDKARVIGRLNTMSRPAIAETDVAYMNEASLTTNTIISFKKRLFLAAGEKKTIYVYCGVSKSEEEIKEMYHKYQSVDAANRLKELAYSKSLVENRFLRYKGKDIVMYWQLLALLSKNNTRKRYKEKISKNRLKQKDLWKYGISGDNPMILVKIFRVNDVYVIKELISAIEYFQKKGMLVDLIIFNEEENKYEQYVQDKIYETISSKGVQYLLHQNGGIFIIKKNDIREEEECLLLSCSDLIINARDGFLKDQLTDWI